MKITDLKCTVIEGYPIVRVDTDEGISGLGQLESGRGYNKPQVLFYKPYIQGMDPRDVERVMLRIRRLGGFKPWGSAVSAIEIALWDIAGKALGAPVYRLLGGKIRDRVRAYNSYEGPRPKGTAPEDFAESASVKKRLPEGFTLLKFFMSGLWAVPGFFYGEVDTGAVYPNRGHLTASGLKHAVNCIKAIKEVLGEELGLAVDFGTGLSIQSALALAKAVEPLNLAWLEDMITGDYSPYNAVEAYRLVSSNTTTPIHTGEQVYLRQGFKDLIEKNAVDVIGPDPCDIGGIAELKWIAEFADLYGVLVAPHGVGDGMIGAAALVQMCATLPKNLIAFELPALQLFWWELIEGLPKPLVKDGYIEVPDKPGLGIELNEKAVRKHLPEGDDFLN